MTHLPRLLTPLLLAAALLSSCSVLQQQNKDQQQEEERKTPTPLYMGEVHQVYPSQNFALLRIIARPLPQAGETLITHPADGSTARMGNLVVSPDTSPNHDMIAADIRSGTVASGDLVFLYRNIAPPEENNDTPTADTPAPGDTTADTSIPGVRVHATRADLPAEKTAATAATAAAPALPPHHRGRHLPGHHPPAPLPAHHPAGPIRHRPQLPQQHPGQRERVELSPHHPPREM